MSVTLEIKLSDESFKRLEKLAKRMGHRNLGNTMELAAQLFEIAIMAVDEGKEVGALETKPDSTKVFGQFSFPKVRKVQAGDVFCNQVINCESCRGGFVLSAGMIYRENPGHESSRHIDCPHCTYCLEF